MRHLDKPKAKMNHPKYVNGTPLSAKEDLLESGIVGDYQFTPSLSEADATTLNFHILPNIVTRIEIGHEGVGSDNIIVFRMLG
jgi:hypothetical protein